VPAKHGWSIAAVAVIIAALVALVLVVTLSGPVPPKVHVEPEVTFALPPTSAGCGGGTLTVGGVARVPLTVSTVAGQTAETLDVCIGGRGPYPFVLDSGAGQSTIDAGLAKRLHLASAGQSSTFFGVGCTGSAQPVASGSWSLDGVALSPQQLTAATLPQIGGKGEPVGLLGSDVLARFGAVRIDFAARALLLPGSEGAALTATSDYTGPLGPAPAALTLGQGTTVPLTVSPQAGDVSLSVAVRFSGGTRRRFVVDTGSSQSVVSTSVARNASLQGTELAQRQATVCSVITVPLVHSGSWSIPDVVLHPQLLGSTNFGAIASGDLDGLLGSDQLLRYGWVVLDYTGGRLVLG
jgi:Aspartyl protease